MSQMMVDYWARCVDAAHGSRARQIVRQVARERHLSAREHEVLARTAFGESTKEVAHALGLSGHTVAYYWARIFRKLGCSSQIEVMSLLFRRATDLATAIDGEPR